MGKGLVTYLSTLNIRKTSVAVTILEGQGDSYGDLCLCLSHTTTLSNLVCYNLAQVLIKDERKLY